MILGLDRLLHPGAGPTGAGTPDPAPPDARGRRWVVATKEAREAIKWLVTAVGAASAVALGAGPVLTTVTGDVTAWSPWRLLALIAGALVAAAAVVQVIWHLLTALVPQELTLADVPASFVAVVEADRGADLPGDITTLRQLREELVAYRIGAANALQDAARAGDRPAKERYEQAAATFRRNYDVLRRAEADLLEQAGFVATREQVLRLRRPLAIWVGVCVLGMCCYLLASSGPTPKTEADSGPRLGTLVRTAGEAGDQLWQALGLAACETSAGQVPVLVQGGRGTATDPYLVQTLPAGGCAATAFPVISPAALVVLPVNRQVTITYRPAPSR